MIYVSESPLAPPRHYDNPRADGDPRMDAGKVEVSGDLVCILETLVS